jgi:hypothetical protein
MDVEGSPMISLELASRGLANRGLTERLPAAAEEVE